jgi:quercetin dioxygenase-like cupin family protein
VQRVNFKPERAIGIDAHGSTGVALSPLTPPLAQGASVQAACFRLAPGGRIGRHPASVPQLLAVVEGSGWVSGAEGEAEPIGAGEAVWWKTGEEHETWTDAGLTAIVIEGEGVTPYAPGTTKKAIDA